MRCHKIRYRTEVDAKIALSSTAYAANKNSSEKRKESRIYRCPRCAGFHLTSQGRRSGERDE